MNLTEREKFIVLVDNDSLVKSDAIILLEGDGFSRLDKVVQLYKAGFAPKVVFSGGISNYSYGSYPFSDVCPNLITLGIPSSAIIHEPNSLNTREQAIEVIRLAIDMGWKRLILVASNYHQYRAYLTFLKVILDSNSNIILYNAPSRSLPMFEETGWGRRIELLDKEFDRIERYTILNHQADFLEAINYQQWKEQQ
jgi:uncharacterized SAM-binding protein YcdF (DUF218 family)